MEPFGCSLMVLQDIDNFEVEHAILDATRNDPEALALVDKVCHASRKTHTLHNALDSQQQCRHLHMWYGQLTPNQVLTYPLLPFLSLAAAPGGCQTCAHHLTCIV